MLCDDDQLDLWETPELIFSMFGDNDPEVRVAALHYWANHLAECDERYDDHEHIHSMLGDDDEQVRIAALHAWVKFYCARQTRPSFGQAH